MQFKIYIYLHYFNISILIQFTFLGKKTNQILDGNSDDEELDENESDVTLKPKGNI